MTTDSLRNAKDRFSEFVDCVSREHDRVVITRNGRPAAVLISPDDLESLKETLEFLGDQDAIRELVEAEAAVVEFITGALIDNPQRVGRLLRNELAGIHSARRGTYRVLHRIDESERRVAVLRIDHRSDVYRSR